MKERQLIDKSARAEPAQGPASESQRGVGAAPNTPRQLLQRQRIAQLQTQRQGDGGTHNGLPEALRSGIESLSGVDMSGVRVHRNSGKPAALQAHAYAQGRDIHLGPGQEQHLPHEAWHLVQQAQGRVRPTLQLAGRALINDDAGLEREADRMGARALRAGPAAQPLLAMGAAGLAAGAPMQRKVGFEFQMLKSKIGLYDSTEPDNRLTGAPASQHASMILNGVADAPKFVVDGIDWTQGGNAEYATTQQYDDPDAARLAVKAIAQHAVTYIGTTGIKALGGNRLFVWQTDNKAQPQLNIDVSFDKVGKEEALRKHKPSNIDQDKFIGINGQFGWSATKTASYLQQRERAKDALDLRCGNKNALRAELIHYQGLALPLVQLGNVPDGVIDALLPLIKLAAMTYISGQLPHGTQLGKDVPILPKVDFSSLIVHMDAILSTQLHADYTLHWEGLTALGDDIIANLGITDTANRFPDSGTAPPTTVGDADAVPVDMTHQTAVMEYRRAREIPVASWGNFAAEAVENFEGVDQ